MIGRLAGARIVDLTLPIEAGHFRWPVERGTTGRLADGDVFEAGWLRTPCHAFTHIDAPSHMVPGGATLDALDLARVTGRAAVIDLADLAPEEAITEARLAARAGHLAPGEIALFASRWDERRDWRSPAYWREAPYLSREACAWLLARRPAAAAFDFPQDYTIRLLLEGEMRPIAEHVSHDVLLRAGVPLIEYLAGVGRVAGPHTTLCALPLRLAGADGAPARVIALEG